MVWYVNIGSRRLLFARRERCRCAGCGVRCASRIARVGALCYCHGERVNWGSVCARGCASCGRRERGRRRADGAFRSVSGRRWNGT
eukprot:4213794-Prymnesium_polylepis.2